MKKLVIILFSLIALSGCLTQATLPAASTTPLSPSTLASPWPEQLKENGQDLLQTQFTTGQSLKPSTGEALSLILVMFLGALLVNGNYRNRLHQSFTNSRVWRYCAQRTATLRQAALATLPGLNKRISCWKKPRLYTGMPR